MSLLKQLIEDTRGKKTYVVSIATALYGLLGIFLGHLTPQEALMLFMGAAGMASLRHGMK